MIAASLATLQVEFDAIASATRGWMYLVPNT
jgi:hypothetical protein